MNILIGITLMYFAICLVYIIGLCVYIHRLTESSRVRVKVNSGRIRSSYE